MSVSSLATLGWRFVQAFLQRPPATGRTGPLRSRNHPGAVQGHIVVDDAPNKKTCRRSWAQLIYQVYEIDPLKCRQLSILILAWSRPRPRHSTSNRQVNCLIKNVAGNCLRQNINFFGKSHVLWSFFICVSKSLTFHAKRNFFLDFHKKFTFICVDISYNYPQNASMEKIDFPVSRNGLLHEETWP